MIDFTVESEKIDQDTSINEEKLDKSYIPDEFPHREDLQEFLFENILSKIIQEGKTPENAFITGASGTGKTAVTKASIEKFSEENDDKYLKSIEIVYINCSTRNSYSKVFEGIADQIGVDWKRGIKNDRNQERLFEEMQSSGKTYLIVLDELDFLKKRNGRNYIKPVIYDLSRIEEVYSEGLANRFSLLGISNDFSITSYMKQFDEDNESGFDPMTRECQPYYAQEISDILEARYREAFEEDILDKEAITWLAKKVKDQYESDIRKGMRVLKNVAKVHQEDKNPKEIVKEAHSIYHENRIEKTIQSCDLHELIVLSSLTHCMENDMRKLDDIRRTYREICESFKLEKGNDKQGAKSKSFVRRRLNKFIKEGLVDRRKNYDEVQNPYVYFSKCDMDLLDEKVNERLDRKGYSTASQEKYLSELDDGKTKLGDKALGEEEKSLLDASKK
ncbi:Cdc6/Cdc18 family protein [Natrinema sp. H-ect4]|uniref:Cdc6/Cdc18 family protein n=1 Tax=Natrinema sp. H-ect4 TaxID=3242699 RepID=UPI0035A9409A